MTDCLYHPEGEGDCHLPDEVLRRIAPAFRYIVFDKVGGDRVVQESYHKLLELPAPDVILQSHRSLFGRTVFVTVADDDALAHRIRFLLQPYSAIEIEYEGDKEACRPMLEKLAGLLGYEIGTRAGS